MKHLIISAWLLAGFGTPVLGQQLPSSAVRAVEQQVAAYNARDIEAFLTPYADSVMLYTFPHTLLSKGKEAMRQRYTSLFSRAPKLHCEIIGRLVEGSTVIDQERVTGIGSTALTGVAIYQIEGEKISKVYFVR